MSFPPIAFLGAGQMAEALIRGVLKAGLVGASDILATDIRPERLEYLGGELGIRTSRDNREGIAFGQLIVIAVKPQDAPGLLSEIGSSIGPRQVLVSIAAGVTIARIEGALHSLARGVPPERNPRNSRHPESDTESALGGPARVVRVMPNTPALIGAGMAAISLGTRAEPADGELVQRLMDSVGRTVMLPEYQLDAVTALSASSPAFVAIFIEGLIDAGVQVGLPRDVATTLTLQTVLGTTRMIQETGRHPAVMKEMVTSPGGTTIAGVYALERGGMRAALIDAIVAATERSKELGKS